MEINFEKGFELGCGEKLSTNDAGEILIGNSFAERSLDAECEREQSTKGRQVTQLIPMIIPLNGRRENPRCVV